jgi:hypothetical protein
VLIHGTGSTCNGANTETQQSPPPSHPEWTPEKAANRGEKEHTGARFITSASEKSSTNTAEPGKGGRRKEEDQQWQAEILFHPLSERGSIFQISFLDRS